MRRHETNINKYTTCPPTLWPRHHPPRWHDVVQFIKDDCVGLVWIVADHRVVSLELSTIPEYSKVGVLGLPLGGNDPICNIVTSGGGDSLIILGPQLGLEHLVVPNVDRLEETGVFGWNELHLDAKILDRVDDGGHHVHQEGVEDEDGHNSFGGGLYIRCQDLIDLLEHRLLIKPCLVLAGVDKLAWQCCQLTTCNVPVGFT